MQRSSRSTATGGPPPPSFTGMIVVTGSNGDLPLATQRRVESIASDRSPFAVACSENQGRNPHDRESIRSTACTPYHQESPAPRTCDIYATTAQNTPVQYTNGTAAMIVGHQQKDESRELGQW